VRYERYSFESAQFSYWSLLLHAVRYRALRIL
jgi:hypothetical protein